MKTLQYHIFEEMTTVMMFSENVTADGNSLEEYCNFFRITCNFALEKDSKWYPLRMFCENPISRPL